MAITTESISYSHNGVTLNGILASDGTGKRPGVIVVHDWFGVGKQVEETAKRLAAQGYVALAADIYGEKPTTPEEAQRFAGMLRSDRELMRNRAKAAYDALKKRAGPIAIMGYCFGGGVALELARSGAPLAGTVSVHGNLDTPHPEDAKDIKARVLVLHGAADPHVPPEQVEAFRKEMEDAKVDWQLNMYGGAMHAFTNPKANNPEHGAAYQKEAAERAWRDLLTFLSEVFA